MSYDTRGYIITYIALGLELPSNTALTPLLVKYERNPIEHGPNPFAPHPAPPPLPDPALPPLPSSPFPNLIMSTLTIHKEKIGKSDFLPSFSCDLPFPTPHQPPPKTIRDNRSCVQTYTYKTRHQDKTKTNNQTIAQEIDPL
jgi:hypothetical protein